MAALLLSAQASAAATIRQRIVAAAARQIGYSEPGDFCTKFGPCEEWCSLFVTWIWRNEGIPVPSLGFTGYMYDWAQLNTAVLGPNTVPKPGDAVLYGTGPLSVYTSRHTGIIEAVYPGYLVTIEGDVMHAVLRFVVPMRDAQRIGEPGPIYGYASPVGGNSHESNRRPATARAASFPQVSRRLLSRQQASLSQPDLLERTIASLRAFQHMPYRAKQVRINWTGVSSRGLVKVRVSTPRHLAYAQHAWKAFLRRYDDAGHAYIVSFKAAPTLPDVPVDITPPQITGIPIVGSPLTIVHGDWTNSPSFYTDLWERCDASGGSCVPIPGATSDSYTPTVADAGQTLVVEEAGWNDGGPGAGALSAPTAEVIALPLL